MIDGSGWYLKNHLDEVEQIVGNLHPTDVDEIRLVQIVLTALQAAKNPPNDKEDLLRSATWVNRTFIAGYFKRKAQETAAVHCQIDPSYS